MMPYYSDEHVTIYHGRAEDVLPTIGPADVVLTDVPYNEVNRRDSGLRDLDRGEADSAPVDVEWVVDQAVRIATGTVYVWCGSNQLGPIRQRMTDHGLTTRAAVWHKSNPSPMNGEHLWLSAIELCVFGRKPRAYFDGRCAPNVWQGPTEPRDDHPTAKPEWLFKRLIAASCPPDGLIVDPYLGSGTTVAAAKAMGRRAIGVEMNEAYCEIAASRCAQGVLAL